MFEESADESDETPDDKQNSDESDETSDDKEEYVMKANVCTRLSRELGLDEIIYEYAGEYDPPEKHGLQNCDQIIPSCYRLHNTPSTIQNLDFYYMIQDQIRNNNPLNKYQMDYIKNLPHEKKNELFDIYNQCVNLFNETMMNS